MPGSCSRRRTGGWIPAGSPAGGPPCRPCPSCRPSPCHPGPGGPTAWRAALPSSGSGPPLVQRAGGTHPHPGGGPRRGAPSGGSGGSSGGSPGSAPPGDFLGVPPTWPLHGGLADRLSRGRPSRSWVLHLRRRRGGHRPNLRGDPSRPPPRLRRRSGGCGALLSCWRSACGPSTRGCWPLRARGSGRPRSLSSASAAACGWGQGGLVLGAAGLWAVGWASWTTQGLPPQVWGIALEQAGLRALITSGLALLATPPRPASAVGAVEARGAGDRAPALHGVPAFALPGGPRGRRRRLPRGGR